MGRGASTTICCGWSASRQSLAFIPCRRPRDGWAENGELDFARACLDKSSKGRRIGDLWNARQWRGSRASDTKPIGVMAGNHVPDAPGTILDVHSVGQPASPAWNLGRKFIGIEREPHFDIACRRIEDAQRQGRLIA